MRRLRALWKFRRSATIASMVGRSWVRRANEIRYGRAIELLQAYGRGVVARHLRIKRARGITLVQKMGRGYLARVYRDRLRAEQELERKRRAKEERERKIRERKEAMEAKEKQAKMEQVSADKDRREKMKAAAARYSGDGITRGATAAASAGLPEAKPITIKRTNIEKRKGEADATGGEELELAEQADDDDLSEGSDLIVEDSDEELIDDKDDVAAGDLQNPRDLLAATAALDVKHARNSIPGLKLGALGALDEVDGQAGPLSDRGKRSTPSLLQRKRNSIVGSMTPRSSRSGNSGFFSSRGRSASNAEARKLNVSKTAKGSIVAASTMRVSKRGDSSWQERFVIVVGDVVFLFMSVTQPEMPLGLRLWPSQVVCLNQSTLALPGHKAEIKSSDCSFVVAARLHQMGSLALQADEPSMMERFALAMQLGVSNVRRSRQQAKLTLAQQMCHEKKLSLLKTQHMIELLHKSQEMFFEAGSGQFDDCNAVCMHSGVMRQSLIDVTPFMPVSDFICEYCACVIIPEENAGQADEMADSKAEEHKQQIKREQQRKLQLDDETLMVARDVRKLRQQRKQAEDEAANMYLQLVSSLEQRQSQEKVTETARMKLHLATIETADVEDLRISLQEQVEEAKRALAGLGAQLASKQARNNAPVEATVDPEDELRRAAPPAETRRLGSSLNIGRKLSFGKGSKKSEDGGEISRGGSMLRKNSYGKSSKDGGEVTKSSSTSGLTRVLSFGKSKKKEGTEQATAEGGGASSKKETTVGGMVRKLSFGKMRR